MLLGWNFTKRQDYTNNSFFKTSFFARNNPYIQLNKKPVAHTPNHKNNTKLFIKYPMNAYWYWKF